MSALTSKKPFFRFATTRGEAIGGAEGSYFEGLHLLCLHELKVVRLFVWGVVASLTGRILYSWKQAVHFKS